MSAPWERQKPPEYHSASEFDRQLWVAGVPAGLWGASLSNVTPKTFKFSGGADDMMQVSATLQKKYLKARVDNPELLTQNRLVVMTSSPTDAHALTAACVFAKALVRRSIEESAVPRVRVDDIQEYEKCLAVGKEFYPRTPSFLAIHNLTPNSSRERLSLVRDLMTNNEGIYRIVVAAADNPFEFTDKALYMEPSEVYHFEGRAKKRMVI